MNNQSRSTWDLSTFNEPELKAEGFGRTAPDIENWHKLRALLKTIANKNGWSNADVSAKSNIAEGTLSQWFSGKYKGRYDKTNDKVQFWLDGEANRSSLSNLNNANAYIETAVSRRIYEALTFAQTLADIVVIVCDAGLGKTETSKHYKQINPNVFMVTMSPHSQTAHGMLLVLASALAVIQNNPGKMVQPIGEALSNSGKGGTLLIVDEAQNLRDEAINQLRHFSDNYGVGIALVGNSEVYDRFKKQERGPSHAQMRSRIGMRVEQAKPSEADLDLYINSWGINDPKTIHFLKGVGQKEGHFRQIKKTIVLANILARGDKKELSYKHINSAWRQRNIEGSSL